MLLSSILLAFISKVSFFVLFKKKKLFFWSAIYCFVLSLKIYTIFLGELNFSEWFQLLVLPTSQMFLTTFWVNYALFSLVVLFHLFRKKNILILRPRRMFKKASIMKVFFLKFFSFFFLFTGFLFLFSARWIYDFFGAPDVNQVIFTLTQPLIIGTDSAQIEKFIFTPLLEATLFTLITWFFIQFFNKYTFAHKRFLFLKNRLVIPLSLFVFLISFSMGVSVFGFENVQSALFRQSTIFEEHYVHTQEVTIEFPEQRRNLIYIFLESMENTFMSNDVGGAWEINLIPNLTSLAQDNIHFSNTTKMGGALSVPGTAFTVGSLVAQTTGTPLLVPEGVYHNKFAESLPSFLPNVLSLGELLEENGYTNTFMIGSNGEFGGRYHFFSQHGNYNVIDYGSAIERGWIAPDYHVFWGYQDELLFKFAKQELSSLANSGQPFHFSLLSVDTHFPEGYVDENTPLVFSEQYANAIYWSDKQVMDFVRWIKEQPFYYNTTIVLVGDHLSMSVPFFEEVPSDYIRTVYHAIINPSPHLDKSGTSFYNRQFTVLDMFPTTLVALGAEIIGDRLGLGTDLFSETPTLVEELGIEEVRGQLGRISRFYTQELMGEKGLEQKITLD